jgi:hypothetical protein
MTKGKIKFYKFDEDILQCDCSSCNNLRFSYVDAKIPKRELTCRERLVNFLRKIIFR